MREHRWGKTGPGIVIFHPANSRKRIVTLVWVVMSCSRVLAVGPIVWVVPSSLHRVGPTDAPGSRTNGVIHAARGEYESLQVAIQAPRGGLSRVNFFVSDLARRRRNSVARERNHNEGAKLIARSNLTLYREKYMTVRHHSPTYNGPPNLPDVSRRPHSVS